VGVLTAKNAKDAKNGTAGIVRSGNHGGFKRKKFV
jgi:hypothetical protein